MRVGFSQRFSHPFTRYAKAPLTRLPILKVYEELRSPEYERPRTLRAATPDLRCSDQARAGTRESRMRTLIFMLAGALAPAVQAAPLEPVWSLAQKEKPAVIETLRELMNIESGSRDKEGLDRLAARLGERLAALGGSCCSRTWTRSIRAARSLGGRSVSRARG